MNDRTGARRLRRFQSAMASLSADAAEVLALHLDGLQYPAIATRLGIEPEEVERLFAQALIQLDRAMEDDGRG